MEYIEWEEGEGALFHYDAFAVCQNILPLLSRSWHSNTKHSPHWAGITFHCNKPTGMHHASRFHSEFDTKSCTISSPHRQERVTWLWGWLWAGYGDGRELVLVFTALQWDRQARQYARNIKKRSSDHCCCRKALNINPLNPELNPICYFLALLGAHHFLHVSRIRVKLLTFRLLLSYIYGAPILDVSRSHTTTHHSR